MAKNLVSGGTAMNSEHPQRWSVVELQYTDGTSTSLTMDASPSLAAFLLQSARETGYFCIRNPSQALMVKSELVAAMTITALTQEE